MDTITNEQKEAIINREADEFLWHLIPFGSMDIMHLVRTAYEVNVSPNELADILYEQAENWCVNLFDTNMTTDLNALFNDYILQQACSEIEELTGIDICNDYDVYFFANFLDCPLQYSNEAKEALIKAIEQGQINIEDVTSYTAYVLDCMGIQAD